MEWLLPDAPNGRVPGRASALLPSRAGLPPWRSPEPFPPKAIYRYGNTRYLIRAANLLPVALSLPVVRVSQSLPARDRAPASDVRRPESLAMLASPARILRQPAALVSRPAPRPYRSSTT